MSNNTTDKADADSTGGNRRTVANLTLADELRRMRDTIDELAVSIDHMTEMFAAVGKLEKEVKRIYQAWSVLRMDFRNAQADYDRNNRRRGNSVD